MDEVVSFAAERIRRWLRLQLIDVRKLGLSVANAKEELTARLEDFCFGNGFVPAEPLQIFGQLGGVVVVLAADDYRTEEVITVWS